MSQVERKFDRIYEYDPRSLSYGILDAEPPDGGIDLRSREIISKVRIKAPGPHLDQGREGACVAMGFTNCMRYEPDIRDISIYNEKFAKEKLYRPAQKEDEFPGEEPEMSGTSLLAVLKIAKRIGLIKSYVWAFNIEQVLIGIGYYGAAMLGLPWYERMSHPERDGRIRVGGRLVGGHCIAGIGYNKDTGRVRVAQSWGDEHGDHGECYLMRDELEEILMQQGECAFILKA